MAVQLKKVQSFIDSVLEKVPEGEREALRAQYSQAQDEVATVDRTLAESITQVNATATKQRGWYEQHKDVIEGRAAGGDGNVITKAVDAAAITKDLTGRLEQTADALASQGLYLSKAIPTLIAQHQAEFGGEILDVDALIEGATKAGMELKTYYGQSVAERRRTALATKTAAEITAAEERGRLAGLKEAGNGHVPYPVNGHGRPPTTLDGLRKPAEGVASTVGLDAAVATATELMNKQAG